MKKEFAVVGICTGILILCLLTSCQREPMTAQRLIDECAQAMGGIEKIDSLQTIRLAQNWPDHKNLIYYEIKRPNCVKLGVNAVFDGERASLLERTRADGTLREARLVPQEEWKDFERDIAWYVPAFFDYPAEYMGTETLDDIKTHKLRVALPLGIVMIYYIDAQTYLVYRVTSHITIDNKERVSERTYSDYREVDGILYPHAFTYEGRDGVFTATMVELEFNVPFEDDLFVVPIPEDDDTISNSGN
ncbi:MAG: hypothetical protein JSU65_12460 [Candidatus Zixiibacteriota bacterium]|nr:MAG: hypothetical protein JSU65_12460 [candidate division Zixibacteria bacterium]